MADAAPNPPAVVPSSYTVGEYVDVGRLPDMPGHLLFIPWTATIPENQEAARQKLEETAAVLRSVFQERHPQLFRTYFNRLLVVAWGIFLPDRFHEGGLSDLTQFKREIIQAAGPLIKASYVRRLARAVVVAIIVILVAAFLLQCLLTFTLSHADDPEYFWYQFGKSVTWNPSFSILHFGALMSASMVGLLFASMSRNVQPTFESLLTPDADLIQPWVRLIFFGIAIFIIALIFYLGLAGASFGNLTTSRIHNDVPTAILIGLLLGVAERALPARVEKWSSDLAAASQRAGQ
jgi:hypothetical protein